MTEDDMLTRVLDAATYGGWRVHHVRRSDRAIQQGAAGFPDIIAIHAGRVEIMAIELKSERGTVSPAQHAWHLDLMAVGIEARIIRPADLVALEDRLLGGRRRAAL